MSEREDRRDLFANECSNPLVWVLAGMAFLTVFLPEFWSELVVTLLFFAFGSLCLFNFRRCRRYHCIITGIGFPAIGLLSLLDLFNVLEVPDWLLWGMFMGLLFISYMLEFRHVGKSGSRYCE